VIDSLSLQRLSIEQRSLVLSCVDSLGIKFVVKASPNMRQYWFKLEQDDDGLMGDDTSQVLFWNYNRVCRVKDDVILDGKNCIVVAF
jgi:hypothetical protein